jgi:hypothetical protein
MSDKKRSVKGTRKREAAKKEEGRIADLASQYLYRCANQRVPDIEPYVDLCSTPRQREEFAGAMLVGGLLTAWLRKTR